MWISCGTSACTSRCNRMLTAECYKKRMERGPYFPGVQLHADAELRLLDALPAITAAALQAGGDDQWSNMLAGADLIRRKEGKSRLRPHLQAAAAPATASKMGKTRRRARCGWMRTRPVPYDFYQYWRNVDDADVEKCLALLDLPAHGRGAPPGRRWKARKSTRPSACWPLRSPSSYTARGDSAKGAGRGGRAVLRRRARGFHAHHFRHPGRARLGQPPESPWRSSALCANPMATRARDHPGGRLVHRR